MNLTKAVLLAIVVAAMGAAKVDFAFCQETESEAAAVPVDESIKPSENNIQTETGLAAFYHATFQGRRTANGESFDHNALTAAHKTLPFGTLVRVINLRNERSVIVRVNDRGPLQKNRVIDVTPRAARELGFLAYGLTPVKLEIMTADELADIEVK